MPYRFDLNLPFKTTMGLKDDNTNAGYKPANVPTSIAKRINKNIRPAEKKYSPVNSFPEI
jgi:hypothetical protein